MYMPAYTPTENITWKVQMGRIKLYSTYFFRDLKRLSTELNCWELEMHRNERSLYEQSITFSLVHFHSRLTPAFNGSGKDNCKTRSETFMFWDLVCLILEIWQYMYSGGNPLNSQSLVEYFITVSVHAANQLWHPLLYQSGKCCTPVSWNSLTPN